MNMENIFKGFVRDVSIDESCEVVSFVSYVLPQSSGNFHPDVDPEQKNRPDRSEFSIRKKNQVILHFLQNLLDFDRNPDPDHFNPKNDPDPQVYDPPVKT